MAHLSQDGKKKIKGRSPIFEVGFRREVFVVLETCLVVKWYLAMLVKLYMYQIISFLDICHTLPNKSYFFHTHPSAHRRSSDLLLSFYTFTVPTFLVTQKTFGKLNLSIGHSQVTTPTPNLIVSPQQNFPTLQDSPGYVTRIPKKHPTCLRASALRKFLFG